MLLLGGVLALPLLPVAAQQRAGVKKAPVKAAPATAEPVYEAYQLQVKPEYAEGQFALQQYLKAARLPSEVQQGKVQGAVLVGFVVRSDGRLTDTFIARGLSAATNAEALRLIQAMPKWRPGRQSDKAVATRFAVTVPFQKLASPSKSSDLMDLADLQKPQVVETDRSKQIYTYVEQMPQFPGGMPGLHNYLVQNLKYPELAQRNQVEGKVFVNFVVRQDGSINDVKVQKGIGAGCDEEAVRVIKAMPAWTPGKQNGRVVNVQYTVPVTFSATPAKPDVGAAETPTPAEEKVYTYVEQMPAIGGSPGGVTAAVQTALKLPVEVREGRTAGLVFVKFVVRANGSVTDAVVARSLCASCDEAALTAVNSLTGFEPGKQNGRAVPVQLTVPVPMYGPNHVFDGGQVAVQASFPGGGTALRQYMTDKLREPKVLKQENLRGAVEVRFVIQNDGRIGAAEVVRRLCRSCDEEALRLVRDMPRWTPARNAAGQPVAQRQNVIIPMPVKPAETAPRDRSGKTATPGEAPGYAASAHQLPSAPRFVLTYRSL
ncbi:hypothetical protein GCM10023186_15710 [Hymenobacter koreensis]|uniref:TonB C-terminal domain-containing protein n=2 Tax=Hymenobacter koreensis TaxID=1084523 RepID=A0ABP8IXP2_9BACT